MFERILITGGAGYVGVPLVELLLKKGYEVRVLDILRWGGDPLLPFLSDKKFSFTKGDTRNRSIIASVANGMDVVIHLAAMVGYPACRREPQLSKSINVSGTENLVAAVGGKIPILFASTGSVYGKMTDDICRETSRLNPLSEYAEHKAEGEKIIAEKGEFTTYRFATAFGVSPRMRLDLLVNNFVYRAMNDGALVVFEKRFMRTFIHVKDMAKSFLFALENYEKMKNEVFNVGSDDMNFTKEDICLAIKKKVDYHLHFAEIGYDVDQRDYKVSYDKLNALGFKTTISMEEGIEELITASGLIDLPNPYMSSLWQL